MPPAGRNNIVARRYQIGGGVRGNVNAQHADAADARHRLHREVLQRDPGRGRRRRRDRRRGQVARAAALKSRDRAVTAEDFETLALRASTGVARAKCLPSQKHDGEVQVVIVPRGDEKNLDLDQAPGAGARAPALRQELPRRAPPGRHRARGHQAGLRRDLAQGDAGAPHRRADRIASSARSRTGCAATCTRSSAAATARAGRSAARSTRPTWPTSSRTCPASRSSTRITIYDEDKRVAVENVRLEPTSSSTWSTSPSSSAFARRSSISPCCHGQQRALVRMPDVVGLPLRKAQLLVRERRARRRRASRSRRATRRATRCCAEADARADGLRRRQGDARRVSRESYVKWLPSIYQRADINGRNFVRDFLWIVQHLFGSVEEIARRHPPASSIRTRRPRSSCRGWRRGRRWCSRRTGRSRRSAASSARRSSSIASAARSRGSSCSSRSSPGTSRTSTRTQWPFRGWRIGVTSEIGIDSVVLPPVNLAHTFVVEMPVSYKDVSPETVIRIHEIIQMEKPANTQYYLRFAAEGGGNELSEFIAIGGGVSAASALGADDAEAITSEEDLQARRGGRRAQAEQPAGDRRQPQDADARDRRRSSRRRRAPSRRCPRRRAPTPRRSRARKGRARRRRAGSKARRAEMAPVRTRRAMEVDQDERSTGAGDADQDQAPRSRRQEDQGRQRRSDRRRWAAVEDPKKDPEKK